MIAPVVALTGISGVGKSTSIKALEALIPLRHFQAGALIKEGRDAAGASIPHDHLRLADLDENQQLLIRGFQRKAAEGSSLILLDGHTIIEKEDRLIPIPATVFGAIGIAKMIFLADDPAIILERRRSDHSRKRPLPSIAGLRNIQESALEQATVICGALGVELYVRRPLEMQAVANILQPLAASRN